MKSIILIYCCLHLIVPEKCHKLNKKKPNELGGLTPYVIGGVEVPITLYPHVAVFTYMNMISCGGSIISDRVILTAAHCFLDLNTIKLKHFEVYLGSSISLAGTKYKVCKIVQHEEFGKIKYYTNDIAVTLLRSKIKFSNSVQKIAIAPHKRWRQPGYYFTIAGFGFHKDFGAAGEPIMETSKKLKATRMQFVDSDLCNRSMTDDGDIMPVFDHQFCMISTKWSSDCHGDSGSGVIWKHKYLVGIVSLGRSTYCGSDIMPSMYTDAVYFKKWVTDQVKNLESHPVNQMCTLE